MVSQPDFFGTAQEAASEVAAQNLASKLRPIDFNAIVGRHLENKGWKSDVAGEASFAAACAAISRILQTPRLGLLVFGRYGTGKTSLVKALTRNSRRPTMFLSMSDPNDVELLDPECWPNFLNDILEGRSVVLDDLGSEPPKMDFGVRKELAADFIVRYHAHGKGRLHITTNLTMEQLRERYTERVTSRLKELCIPLELLGGDKRKWGVEKLKSSGVEKQPFNHSTIQPFNRQGGAA